MVSFEYMVGIVCETRNSETKRNWIEKAQKLRINKQTRNIYSTAFPSIPEPQKPLINEFYSAQKFQSEGSPISQIEIGEMPPKNSLIIAFCDSYRANVFKRDCQYI